MNSPLTVLKFGSSVLQDENALPLAVSEIYRHVRRGHRVLAVVSAFGSTTDELLAQAQRVSQSPSPHLLAHLLATGETTSAAMLGLALEREGISARKLSTRCLETRGPILDSTLVSLDCEAVEQVFERSSVAILPGFVGFNREGEECLLGRGGSDLTALFVARALQADDCVLVKDVPGLFEHDPAREGPKPRRFESVRFDDALALKSKVVQPKALRFARKCGLRFRVGAIGEDSPTLVGAEQSSFLAAPAAAASAMPEPRQVALLGLGAVGSGVFHKLLRQPETFQVAKILVRDPEPHIRRGVPRELLTTNLAEVFESSPSILVELLGGIEPARGAMLEAARRGIDVVSANKAVIADHGDELRESALRNGSELRYSASVGGVVPAIESVQRVAKRVGVVGFEGVLNGTANFILDQLEEGQNFDAAVHEAQERGLAEADPTLDLDGTDVAHKLIVLAREAFGALPIRWEHRSGLLDLDPAHLRAAARAGQSMKLVGSCRAMGNFVQAAVRLVRLEASHPLARLRGEENALCLLGADGRQELWIGKGAGRWPTSEAVFADLVDVVAARQKQLARKARAS